MGRKKLHKPRKLQPDAVFQDVVVGLFVNKMMKDGKKSIAQKAFYQALDLIEQRTKKDSLRVFRKAIENIKPIVEVRSRRVGGANYQVPMEVRTSRQLSLATRWLVEAARKRLGHTMAEKLASEILEASEGHGHAMKKREEVHRMAEANKAFSHFRW